MSGLMTDIRDAARSLRGAPTYTTLAILTLALGIGATTAIFTVVNSVLLSPLPYRQASELVQVDRVADQDESSGAVAWPDFRDWRDMAPAFSGLAAFAEGSGGFAWGGEAESLGGYFVTRDFFHVMGVELALGRTFSETEDVFGGAGAIIISYQLWQSRFAGDPGVVGRSVTVDGESLPVVGVAPAGFSFPSTDVAFWRPLQGDQILADAGLPTNTRNLAFLRVVGRLADTTVAAAQAQLVQVSTSIDLSAGKTQDQAGAVRVQPLADAVVGDVSSTLLFLLAAVGLVLVVACANVAGLMVSRTAARERELSVRLAMGAGRARIVRQLLTESVMVAIGAGVSGSGLAWVMTQALHAAAPAALPRLDDIHLGPQVLLASAGLTVLAGVLCGLLPAWRASRTNAQAGLASGSRGSTGSRASIRPQRYLVVAQVAVSVILLSAAALLGTSFARLTTVDRGFDADRVILASVQPSDRRYSTPEAVDGFYKTLLARFRALPEIASATATYSPPLADNGFATRVARQGEETETRANIWAGTVIIRDQYFETLGIPLLSGRDFTDDDRLGRPLVAIVNQAMAERLWPGEDAVGKRFSFTDGLQGTAESFDRAYFPREPYTVVGVAGDVRRNRLDEAPTPEYYRPHAQIAWASQFLLIRTSGDPGPIMRRLRAEVWDVDPTVPVPILRTLDSTVAASVATPRFRMLLVAGFAGTASLLAMVGLYAVLSMAVQRRVREMGIRLALGARRAQVMRRVLRDGLALVVFGLGLGLSGAYLASSTLTAMLFGVGTGDPVIYLGVVMVTTVCALGACYLPARRASRVDPMVSLRDV